MKQAQGIVPVACFSSQIFIKIISRDMLIAKRTTDLHTSIFKSVTKNPNIAKDVAKTSANI